MATTTLSRRREQAYSVVAVEPGGETDVLYAFHDDGAEIKAWFYTDGEWTSDRGSVAATTAEGDPFDNAAPILLREDPSATIGPGSLAWRDRGRGSIRVWDVEGGAVYEHQTAALLGPPAWRDGWVYWVERATANTFELWRARGDLAEPELVDSHSVGPSSGWTDVFSAIHSVLALIADATHSTGEVNSGWRVRFAWLGGSDGDTSPASVPDSDGPPILGLPEESGGSLGIEQDAVRHHGPSIDDEWEEHAPPEWLVNYRSLSVSEDGSRLGVYGEGLGLQFLLIRASATQPETNPETSVVSPHPVFAVVPSWMYLRD